MWPNLLTASEGQIDVQYFFTTAPASAAHRYVEYRRPHGARMLWLWIISGGHGGGGGFTRIAGAAGGGGGGGASGTPTSILIPWDVLPDTLFMLPGSGGAGGAANTAGSTGIYSAVMVEPVPDAFNSGVGQTLLVTPVGGAIAAGNAGGGGASAAVGAAGTANTGSTSQGAWNGLGIHKAFNGLSGASGGAVAGGAGNSITIAGPYSGGAGGGGTTSGNFAGGFVDTTSIGPYPSADFGAAGAATGGNGWNCPLQLKPFPLCFGGSGGGSANSVAGGRGGNGGFGGGGGGGGAGTTGGAGGNGGPGLIIAVSW